MGLPMTVTDYEKGKLITLSKAFDSKSKILFAFYFILFACSGCRFTLALMNKTSSIGLTIFLIIVSVIFFIAAFRFANKAALSEKVYIDHHEFKIIRQALLRTAKTSYDISLLANFRYLQKPELTKHPLAGL
jgi:hypothetical protein